MSLNSTPAAGRIHIGFFGCCNAGKSQLVNALTGQSLAVVSDTRGTTTDPVSKAMEILPLGPVLVIDTPGFDDDSALGEKRVEKTRQILGKTDLAILVVDGTVGMSAHDQKLLSLFREKQTPYLIAWNKCDLPVLPCPAGENVARVSAVTGEGIAAFKQRLIGLVPPETAELRLVADLIAPGELVILVTPIDESAPKGRMILPQQQVLRDVLDAGGMAVVTKQTELAASFAALSKQPAMVITDSQVFEQVARLTPEEIPLTSFSILMARCKGILETAVSGVAAIGRLQSGDTVLLAEGCTHHRQCNDIGTVKIPRWLAAYTGKALKIETCSGTQFPEDLTPYAAVIHCGGCMLNQREVQTRMQRAVRQGVPFTNYGVAIAAFTGILERSLRPFPEVHALLR